MIHLVGDSIFLGAALKNQAAQIAPFLAPANSINTLLSREAARFATGTGLPGSTDKARSRFLKMQTAGLISPGDTMVLLDAGPHASDPDLYERLWLTLIVDAKASGANVLACNTFDNFGATGEDARCAYGVRFGARSHNDAIQAAAGAAQVSFLDVAGPIAALQDEMVAMGMTAYRSDKTHLNIIGSLALSALICRALYPDEPLSTSTFEGLAEANYSALHLRSPEVAVRAVRRAISPRAPS